MFLMKGNNRRDLREAYRAAEKIQTAQTPREAGILTGYAIGIIDEKVNGGRLSQRTADAIAEMVEVIGEDVRRELITARHAEESQQDENNILRIAQFPVAAE